MTVFFKIQLPEQVAEQLNECIADATQGEVADVLQDSKVINFNMEEFFDPETMDLGFSLGVLQPQITMIHTLLKRRKENDL